MNRIKEKCKFLYRRYLESRDRKQYKPKLAEGYAMKIRIKANDRTN